MTDTLIVDCWTSSNESFQAAVWRVGGGWRWTITPVGDDVPIRQGASDFEWRALNDARVGLRTSTCVWSASASRSVTTP